jgi:hypothetical protein
MVGGRYEDVLLYSQTLSLLDTDNFYIGSECQGRDRPFSNELYVLYHAYNKADEKVGISSASTDK